MSGFFNIFGRAKAENGGGGGGAVAGAGGGGSASGGSGGAGGAGGKGQNAISSLQAQVQKKEGRVKYLEAKCARLNNEAKKLMMKKPKPDKRGAMQKIKQRKVYEKQIDQITGQIMNLETQIMSIESMVDASSAFAAMNAGKEAFAEISKTVNSEEVSTLMEDMEDAIANADEISDALAQPVGEAGMLDDDELLGELDGLLEEEEEGVAERAPTTASTDREASSIGSNAVDAMPSAPSDGLMPAAPSAKPVAEDAEEEANLAELAAMM